MRGHHRILVMAHKSLVLGAGPRCVRGHHGVLVMGRHGRGRLRASTTPAALGANVFSRPTRHGRGRVVRCGTGRLGRQRIQSAYPSRPQALRPLWRPLMSLKSLGLEGVAMVRADEHLGASLCHRGSSSGA